MFLTVAENTYIEDASRPLHVLLSSSTRFPSAFSDDEEGDCDELYEDINETVCYWVLQRLK